MTDKLFPDEDPAQLAHEKGVGCSRYDVVTHKGSRGTKYAAFDCPSCGCPMEFELNGGAHFFVCRDIEYRAEPHPDFPGAFRVSSVDHKKDGI